MSVKWPTLQCRQYRKSISLLASGVLPQQEQAAVERHLSACGKCQRYYKEMTSVVQELRQLRMPQVELTQAMRSRWESEIKKASEESGFSSVAAAVPCGNPVRLRTAASTQKSWLRELFWPYRPVWATLAAVWLLILALNLSSREKSSGTMAKAPPVSAEAIMEARAQRQRLMAELVQSFPMSVTPSETPKHSVSPGPRSEFQNRMGA